MEIPWGADVCKDSLLYIGLEQERNWVRHPLCQYYQCIPFLASKKRQKGGRAKDFSGG